MALTSFLDPVFLPVIYTTGVLWGVVIISVIISFVITIIYKYTTDQKLMKQLKDEMKKDQEKMKTLKDKPAKMMEIQKGVMQKNMKYMMQSMKATLITFLPIILIFGWMNAHLAFEPVAPNTVFNVTAQMREATTGNVTLRVGDATTGNVSTNIAILGDMSQPVVDKKAEWQLRAGTGEYFLEYSYSADGTRATRYVTVTTQYKYHAPVETQKEGAFANLGVQHSKLIVLNLFGWKLGWLGTYIILSILLSIGLRKLLNVY